MSTAILRRPMFSMDSIPARIEVVVSGKEKFLVLRTVEVAA